jgi:hypothetical protein
MSKTPIYLKDVQQAAEGLCLEVVSANDIMLECRTHILYEDIIECMQYLESQGQAQRHRLGWDSWTLL